MATSDKHIHILQKAEELFAKKGYEATTVRDIAEAADVNLAMISYYFGSKEKLMESLFKERMMIMRLKTETLIGNKSLTAIEKVEAMVDNYVDRIIEKQSFYKIMLCEQIINKNTSILKHLKDLKLSYAKLFTELIFEGQQQKVFKPDIDVMLLMNSMTGTATQTVVNKEYYREFNNYKKISLKEFDHLLMEKLRVHIKNIFKAILGYEQ